MTNRRSPAWRLFILMIGAIALLGLVAASACGGDDDDGNDNGGGDPTATADGDNGDTGDNGGDDGDDGDGDGDGDDGDGDGDGDSLADLANFGEDYESFTGKVTYNIASFTGEDSGVGSISIYQKDGRSRFDISSEDGDLIFISTLDATYVCSDGTCLKYPADDDTATAVVDSFVSLFSGDAITQGIGDIPTGVDIDVTSETIGGLDATCFQYSGDLDSEQTGDEKGEFCFSDGGLLLRLKFEGAGETGSFEATAASDDVPDSDFDPPFEVTDLSDLFQP